MSTPTILANVPRYAHALLLPLSPGDAAVLGGAFRFQDLQHNPKSAEVPGYALKSSKTLCLTAKILTIIFPVPKLLPAMKIVAMMSLARNAHLPLAGPQTLLLTYYDRLPWCCFQALRACEATARASLRLFTAARGSTTRVILGSQNSRHGDSLPKEDRVEYGK